jgi:hypothetical protein
MRTIRRANPRLQGLVGLGAAIAHFCEEGWAVSLPLNDSQAYDLIVDDGAQLLRVQVKTTTFRNPAGNYVCRLETAGGNQSFHTRKPFDHASSDLLFILTDGGAVYLIPCADFTNTNSITLTDKYDRYRRGPERS